MKRFRDRATRNDLGTACVRMSTAEEAAEALSALNMANVKGKIIHCKYALDKSRKIDFHQEPQDRNSKNTYYQQDLLTKGNGTPGVCSLLPLNLNNRNLVSPLLLSQLASSAPCTDPISLEKIPSQYSFQQSSQRSFTNHNSCHINSQKQINPRYSPIHSKLSGQYSKTFANDYIPHLDSSIPDNRFRPY